MPFHLLCLGGSIFKVPSIGQSRLGPGQDKGVCYRLGIGPESIMVSLWIHPEKTLETES